MSSSSKKKAPLSPRVTHRGRFLPKYHEREDNEHEKKNDKVKHEKKKKKDKKNNERPYCIACTGPKEAIPVHLDDSDLDDSDLRVHRKYCLSCIHLSLKGLKISDTGIPTVTDGSSMVTKCKIFDDEQGYEKWYDEEVLLKGHYLRTSERGAKRLYGEEDRYLCQFSKGTKRCVDETPTAEEDVIMKLAKSKRSSDTQKTLSSTRETKELVCSYKLSAYRYVNGVVIIKESGNHCDGCKEHAAAFVKDSGFNSIRRAHFYPPLKEFILRCGRYGASPKSIRQVISSAHAMIGRGWESISETEDGIPVSEVPLMHIKNQKRLILPKYNPKQDNIKKMLSELDNSHVRDNDDLESFKKLLRLADVSSTSPTDVIAACVRDPLCNCKNADGKSAKICERLKWTTSQPVECTMFQGMFCFRWQGEILKGMLKMDRAGNTLSLMRTYHLDATGSITKYGFMLYTLMTQHPCGRGIPLAYMFTASATADEIERFLTFASNALQEPINIQTKETTEHIPLKFSRIVVDNDTTEQKGIQQYAEKQEIDDIIIVLCWFHVKQRMERVASSVNGRLGSDRYVELQRWLGKLHYAQTEEDGVQVMKALKRWMTIEQILKEDENGNPIKGDVWSTFWNSWMKDDKWKMYCEAFLKRIGDTAIPMTNNCIESWHNILKTTFLNRSKHRLDKLVNVLNEKMFKHIICSIQDSDNDKGKMSVLVKRLQRAYLRVNCVEFTDRSSGKATVKSTRNPGGRYTVDLSALTCDCQDHSSFLCPHLHTVMLAGKEKDPKYLFKLGLPDGKAFLSLKRVRTNTEPEPLPPPSSKQESEEENVRIDSSEKQFITPPNSPRCNIICSGLYQDSPSKTRYQREEEIRVQSETRSLADKLTRPYKAKLFKIFKDPKFKRAWGKEYNMEVRRYIQRFHDFARELDTLTKDIGKVTRGQRKRRSVSLNTSDEDDQKTVESRMVMPESPSDPCLSLKSRLKGVKRAGRKRVKPQARHGDCVRMKMSQHETTIKKSKNNQGCEVQIAENSAYVMTSPVPANSV